MSAKPCFNHKSMTAAKKNAKRILREYDDRYGVPITGDDAEFLTLILENHPDFEMKIGAIDNIDYHVVKKDGTNSRWGRGFRTKRRDNGKLVEWSYPVAIDGKHRDPRRNVETAFRWEVEDWVKQQGRAYDMKTDSCAESWEPIEPGESQLHHTGEFPFRRIVYEFMWSPYAHAHELDWDTIKLKKRDVGVWILADPELAKEFIRFHADLAEIVRVTTKAHHELSARDTAVLKRSGQKHWDTFYACLDLGPYIEEAE
jgi:hypothetical protein